MLYLRHGGEMLPDAGEGLLVSDLEVDVDELVREGGELVGEARLVLARHLRLELVRVVLLLHLLVEHVVLRVRDDHVHVVLPAGHHLKIIKKNFRENSNIDKDLNNLFRNREMGP